MSLFERVEHLDREIATAVDRAVSALREEISERLREGSDELVRRLRAVEPKLPATFLRREDVAPLADEASTGARNGAFAELRDALVAVDGAGSQAEILNALLAESGRFAARAAILLLRDSELRGWGGRGWEQGGETLRGVALAPAGAWSRLAEGRGAVRLSADECAELAGRLGGAAPRGGVLVPLVLRDRVAAAFYADADGGPLAVEALQTLVYVAAQAIESLPFRQRRDTPTLRLDDSIVAAAPVEAPPPLAEPPAQVPEAEVPELAGSADGAVLEEREEPEPEPVVALANDDTAAITEDAEVTEIPEISEPQEDALESTASLPWAVVEEAPAPSAAPETLERPETPEITAAPKPAAEAWSAYEELPPVEDLPVEELPPIEAAETESWSEPPPELAEEVRDEPAPQPWGVTTEPAISPAATGPIPTAQGRETVLLRRPGFDEAAPEPEPAATQEASFDNVRPLPGVEPAAPAAPRPSIVGAPAGPSPEVRPPSDVEGPGWAFATSRLQVASSDETQHEEARRLARLLVSEIKLYNEEQVDEGRRNRDIYERLKEDIDRSRQMYEERVDQRLLNTTDYFYQELVRILAAGDSKALGI